MSSGNLRKADVEKWIKAGVPIAGKSDGGGLTFTLSRVGTASWVFRYRYGGRQREITLGNYPDVPLEDASFGTVIPSSSATARPMRRRSGLCSRCVVQTPEHPVEFRLHKVREAEVVYLVLRSRAA